MIFLVWAISKYRHVVSASAKLRNFKRPEKNLLICTGRIKIVSSTMMKGHDDALTLKEHSFDVLCLLKFEVMQIHLFITINKSFWASLDFVIRALFVIAYTGKKKKIIIIKTSYFLLSVLIIDRNCQSPSLQIKIY